MKGRKPKPIEQREREGNPSKRKLPVAVRSSEPRQSVRPRPANLPKDAEEIWDDLVIGLDSAGVLDQLDYGALTAMTIQWARATTAGRIIQQEGLVAMGSMSQLVEHPMLGTERAAHALFLRYAEQYGLTPVARARVAAALTARGSTDPLAGLFGPPSPVAFDIELDDYSK